MHYIVFIFFFQTMSVKSLIRVMMHQIRIFQFGFKSSVSTQSSSNINDSDIEARTKTIQLFLHCCSNCMRQCTPPLKIVENRGEFVFLRGLPTQMMVL